MVAAAGCGEGLRAGTLYPKPGGVAGHFRKVSEPCATHGHLRLSGL